MVVKGDQIPEKGRQRRIVLFAAALFFLVVAIFLGSLYHTEGYRGKDVRNFEKVLHRKERVLKEEFRQLEDLFTGEEPVAVLDGKSARYQKLGDQGISIFYYENDTLKYWSDHSIQVPAQWEPRFGKHFISLRNADYVSVIRETDSGRLLGMIEIKTHYPFQNDFLINRFQRDFKLDPAVTIAFLEANGSEAIYNDEGVYLFSFNFDEVEETDKLERALGVISLLLFFALLLAAFFSLVKHTPGRKRYTWMGLITLLVAGTVVMILKYDLPSLFTGTELFRPDLFANQYFPSLGALLVLTLASLVVVLLYCLYGNLEKLQPGGIRRLVALIFFAVSALLLLLIEKLMGSLVLDSGISFEAHRVTTFTGYTVLGLMIIIIWFIMLGLVIDKAIILFSGSTTGTLLTGMAVMSATMIIALLFPGNLGSWSAWGASLLFLGGHLYLRYHQSGRIPFSRFIFLLFFISVFMTLRFQYFNRINVEQQKEVELVKLSSEHDPVAEMLFSEMSMSIRSDTVFALYLNQPYIDIEKVVNRLERNYFSGYWTKYDLLVTVCRPNDSVYLEPPVDERYHCYTFFDEMIRKSGIEIPGSDFYFLNNLNGRISYLASIPYFRADNEHRLFIELDSKILSEELGYPELLLDKNSSSFSSSHFSFAKYNGGQLITQQGDFPYRRSCRFYTSGKAEFEKITREKYDHSIYNMDDQNTIVVSSPRVTLVDYMISFSYIFALNFLWLSLIYMLAAMKLSRPGLNWNFKNRIQYSMVGILFLTFLLICWGTIYFIIQQYRVKHNDNLRHTMRSVYIELIHQLEYEEDLVNWSAENYYNMDEMLRKLSNVFYSDINLYDRDGYLLATSRAEIFDRQLLSSRMNRLVYENLTTGEASEYIHNERIGRMKYISAYIPLLNNENKFLAYLNLPYFTQSGALARDVTNLVVAVINIYLIFLLVTLLVSVLLADRITQPLRMIQSRIAQVSLSKKNEMIRYDRNDEIKGLVEEYNYMVQELERSAGLLAQSERESAWREMAKQIAHEIKNPLTPMKLNVQHLQRALAAGEEDPEMIQRISATLIEQIDSLSAIANEFSDFAKMPKAKNVRINLAVKLKSLLRLFENTEKAHISLDLGGNQKVYVVADHEQLMRVFINLVKNGLQAIPDNREGMIRIKLEVESNHKARIMVSDNGKGIPEAIRDKLFQPNFTTKSAGMGMGLAISYNIVRSLGGRIWYDTTINQGTTFFVELPLSGKKD